MWSVLRKRSELRWILIAAIAYFIVVLGFCLYRYNVFYSDSDHGIFSQVFWNNIHGRWFQSSLSSTYSVSVTQEGNVPEVFYHRLAQHFTPALLLWIPIYALFPFPPTLMVLKVALLTAAGPVLYILARQYLQPRLSALITVSFYGANTVIGPALGEFYDAAQLPLFVFGMLLAMEKRSWAWFGALGVLTCLIREDAGLVPFGIGFYMLLSRRFPRIGLLTCALSFGYMLVLTTQIMPLFTDEVSRRFMVEEFGQFTDDEQASTVDVIWAMLSRPWLLVGDLFASFDKIVRYLLGHWLPLAFVPALSPPAWMVSGFPLLMNFLRREDGPLSLNIRYTTPIVPGLFYGAILWWSTHQARFKSAFFRRFWLLCLFLSLVFTFTSNPHRAWSFIVPDSIQPWVHVSLSQQLDHAATVRSLLTQIPPDASVSASRYLIAHLPNRRAVLRFPGTRFRNDDRQVVSVDYVMVDLRLPLIYQVAFRSPRRDLLDDVPAIERLLERRYGIVGFRDGVVLLQRRTPSQLEAQTAWLAFRQEIEPMLQQIRAKEQ
jgi:uncharacterized membrane protein